MKSIFSYLIIFISFGISAQNINSFSIDQKGILLADSKNPYSLISLVRYNLHQFIHDKSFKGLDSITLTAIQQWNRSHPKEKIALNSFLRESDEPIKNKKGEDTLITLPDGTMAFQYKIPDTIYYSFDFNQLSLKYEGTDKIPTTIQLLNKSSKKTYIIAEFPASILYSHQLVTYYKIDPVPETDLYMKHVENTRIRFNKNGISKLIIKDPWKYYLDEKSFFKHFIFDSIYTVNEQKVKLKSILKKTMSIIYDTTYYTLTNMYGEDSLIRDPKYGDLISVTGIKIDTLFSINEVHSLYKKQVIYYNSKTEHFEIIDEAILICLEGPKSEQLIIDQVTPYPVYDKKNIQAYKYDLNNNPFRILLHYNFPFPLITLEQLYEVKTHKQKRGEIESTIIE